MALGSEFTHGWDTQEDRDTMPLDEQAAIARLVESFPETKSEFAQLRDTWSLAPEELGIYIVFGDLFGPRIFRRLMTEEHEDKDSLRRFFSAMDELYRDGNKLVRGFVLDEICEPLLIHPEWWHERVAPYIGPELVIACQEARIFIEDLFARHQRNLDEGLEH
jgi:hypothetical protein